MSLPLIIHKYQNLYRYTSLDFEQIYHCAFNDNIRKNLHQVMTFEPIFNQVKFIIIYLNGRVGLMGVFLKFVSKNLV